MRMLLVVNPHATRVTTQRRSDAVRILGAEHDLTVAETTHRGHATDLARRAVADGVDCVAVLGGDGTLNEVAVSLADSDCLLACLPGGGTNVLSRTIGQPDDVAGAAEAIVESIRTGSTERIGLGSVNGRYFTFHSGIGWDASLVSVVERHATLKRRIGHLLFVYAGLRTYFGGYDRRHPHFTVELPGGEVIENGFFSVVMNSDPYTFVHRRPFTISPSTRLDGPLTVVVLRSMKVRHFLPLMIDALRDRTGVTERPWLRVQPDVSEVTVRRITAPVERTMSYQVDGDHLGDVDVLQFLHHPEALTVVIPSVTEPMDAATPSGSGS